MKYLIQINGDVKGPFPIEKLIEEGVTKKTRVCLDDAEEWVLAENVRELDAIWETNKVIPKKAIENKKENKITTIQEKESIEQIEIEEKPPKVSGAIFSMLKMGALIIVLFGAFNWTLEKCKEPRKDTETGEQIGKIQETSEPEPTQNGLENPQKEYNQLIEEGYEYCKKDSLQNAFEKISTAAIVRDDYELPISDKAQYIYEESLKKGDIAFGDGDIKELIPYALEFYEIAKAANPTPEVEAKIQKCKSIQ